MSSNSLGIPHSDKGKISDLKIIEDKLSKIDRKVGPLVHPIFEKLSIMGKEGEENSLSIESDEKEVKKYSQLESKEDSQFFADQWKNEESTTFETNLVAKTLANLFNDCSLASIHQKSRLPFESITGWLVDFLKKEKSEGTEVLIDLFKQFNTTSEKIRTLKKETEEAESPQDKAKLLQKCSDDVAKDVKSLDEGQSFLMEGTWLAANGVTKHVMYHFTRISDDKFDIKVFNNNPEAIKYQTSWKGESTTLVRPLIHYQGIPSVELFFNDDGVIRSDFFQAVIQPSLLDKEYSSAFIFEKVFTFLHKYRTTPSNETVGFMTAKQDFATAWNAIQTVLFTHLKKEDYKKLVWKIRKEALITGYQSSKSSLHEPGSEEMRTLLKNCALTLIQSTTRKYEGTIINDEEAKEARATAQQLLSILSNTEDDLAIQQKGMKKWDLSGIDSLTHEEPLKEVMETLIKPDSFDTSPQMIINTPVLAPFVLPEDPSKLAEALRGVIFNSSGDFNNAIQIEEIVKTFPIPVVGKTGYWDKIDKYSLSSLISEIGDLVTKYQKAAMESSKDNLPTHSLTSRSLYVILHRLLLAKEKDEYTGLANYSLFFNGAYQDKDPFYFHSDPEAIERDQALRRYFIDFEEKAGKKTLFDFKGLNDGADTCGDWSYYRKLPGISWNYPNKEFLKKYSEYFDSDVDKLSNEGLIQAEMMIDLGQGRLPKEIQALKRAAFLDYAMSHQRSPHGNGILGFFCIKWFRRNLMGVISIGLSNARLFISNTSSLMPKISSEAATLFSKTSRFTKDRDENTILTNKNLLEDKYEKLVPQQLFLSESKGGLKPRQMLLHYKKHLSSFDKPEQQTLFESLLFRSIVNEKEQSFSLFEQIQEGSLCNQYEQFIKDGIELFTTFQPNERVHVQAALFFIRLANRLHRLNPDRFQTTKEHIALMQEWLKIEDLTNEERSAIHLQLIHQYRSFPAKERDDEMISFICRSWFLYQNDPIKSEWKYPLMEREAQAFMLEVISESCSWRALYIELEDLWERVEILKSNISFYKTNINTAQYHLDNYKNNKQYYTRQGIYESQYTSTIEENKQKQKDAEERLKLRQEQIEKVSKIVEEKKSESVSVMKKRAGGILADLGLVGNTDAYQLEVKSPNVLKLTYDKNNVWEIHLSTGKVYNLLGAVTKLSSKPQLKGLDEERFNRLFDKNSHSFFQSGNSFLFTSKKYGSIQMIPLKKKEGLQIIEEKEETRQIQRQVDGSWYKFNEITKLNVKGIPRALLHGRTAWTSLHKVDSFNGESLEAGFVTILTSASGKNEFLITEKGTIHPIDGITGKPKLTVSIGGYSNKETEFDLSLIEDPRYIVVENDADKKPRKISLVRYGITFNIIEEKGVRKAFWADKPDYFISLEQPQGIVGSVPNYLVLQHKERQDKKKALLPCLQGIKKKNSLSRTIALKIPKTPEIGETLVDNTQFFIEVDLKGDKAVAYAPESVLYLAFLYMAQKDYNKAFALIEKIGEAESLSKDALSVMGWIMSLPTSSTDPTGIAFSLRIAAMYQKNYLNYRRQDLSLQPLENTRLIKLFQHYCRRINDVPTDCELSYDEEMLLINAIQSHKSLDEEKAPDLSWVENRKSFLLKEKYRLSEQRLSDVQEYIGVVNGYISKKSDLELPYSEVGFYLFENEQLVPEKVRRLQKNIEEAQRVTDFLPEDEKSLKDTYRVSRRLNETFYDISDRRNFWYEAFLILTKKEDNNATNKAERRQLALRLELMNETDLKSNAMQYLHSLFGYVNKIPEKVNLDSLQSRWDFTKILNDNLADVYRWGTDSKQYKWNEEKLIKRKNAFQSSSEVNIFSGGNIFNDRGWVEGPIPFKQAPIPKHVEKYQNELVFVPIESDQTEFLESLYADYFEKPSTEDQELENKKDAKTIDWTKIKIGKDYESFKEVIEKEFEEFNEEYQKGVQRNIIPTYPLKDKKTEGPLLSKKLELKRKQLEKDSKEMEKSILLLANSKSSDKQSREQELLRKESLYKPDLTMADLRMLFFQRRRDGFINANRNLGNKDLDQKLTDSLGETTTAVDLLYTMIGQYMELTTYADHLAEIEENALKLEKMQENDQVKEIKKDDLERKEIIRLIGSGLKYQRPDKSKTSPDKVFFQYCSRKRLRPRQGPLLDLHLEKNVDEKCVSLVSQAMMGEGKTSVIGFMKLVKSLQPGRISLFVVPDAQYDLLKTNLGQNLKQIVNKSLVAIDYPPHELFDPEVLLEMKKKLQNAMEVGAIVMMKPHVLEFLWAILKKEVCESCEGESIDPLQNTLINALVGNVCLFAMNADGLIDEGDTLLSLGKEVIIPSGTPKKIDPRRIRFVAKIFSLMMKEFRKETGFDTNRQTLLSHDVLKNTIAPAIAKHLAEDYRALKLHGRPELHESFARYVSDTMPNKLQIYLDSPEKAKTLYGELESKEDILDLQFLKYRQELKEGKEGEVEAFHQTALCRHLFSKLFQETFNREGGRHYGESGKKDEVGKIVPFKAVGIPDVTEFGYHYEALILNLLYGLQFKIGTKQFKLFVKKKHEAATKEAQKNKCSFESTKVAEEFKELTGMALSLMDKPKEQEKARQYVNENFDSLLSVQSEFAEETITYYSSSYTANGLSLVGLLNTVQAFSATLANYETFHEKLSNVILDQGIKGQILSKVIERAENNEHQVHIVKNNVLKDFLGEMLSKHPHKNDVIGFFDAAGTLKDMSNNEVSYQLWDFFHPKEGSPPVDWDVKWVFTFHQFSKDTDPVPAVLFMKDDALEMIKLGGTTKACFEEKGIDLEKTFFFINEKGCVGTDLPFPKGKTFGMTANATQGIDFICQAYLRARDFFNTQNVESIICEEVLEKIKTDKSAIKSIINQSILNQAIQLSKEIYKSVPLKIDQIFEWNILYTYLIEPYHKNGKVTDEDIQAIGKFSSFLKTVREDDVGNQYGRLEVEVDSKEALEKYAKSKLDAFKKCSPPKQVLTSVEKLIDSLFSQLSKKLPKTVKQSSETQLDNAGLQSQMLQTTQMKTTEVQKTEIQQDQNVEQELKRYQNINSGSPKNEEPWNDKMIDTFLSSAIGQKESLNKHLTLNKKGGKDRGCSVVSFNEMFSKDKRGFNFSYDKPYEKIFHNVPYYATENFIHTHQQQLPFFHSIQRPTQQILVVKGHRRHSFFYLSKDEAVAFKNYLDKKALKGVWLIQHDGSTLLANDDLEKLDLEAAPIKRGLLMANILNRNMTYVESHREETLKWLNTPCGTLTLDESYKLKAQFVKLSMAQNKEEYALLSQSKVFNKESSLDISRKMDKLRKKSGEKDSKICAMSVEEIRVLGEKDKDLIQQLDVDQVSYLDPANVQYLLPNQIEMLSTSKLIQAVPKELFPYLQEYQMYYINEEQLTWIDPTDGGHIEALPKPLMLKLNDEQYKNISVDQIESLTDEKDMIRLIDEQLVFLLPKQIELITNLKLIQRIPLDLVQHLTANQVPQIKESQIEGLLPNQIPAVADDFVKKLPNRLVPYISGKQVKHILEDQVQYLTSPETINSVPLEWLHHVSKALRRQHLSKDKVSAIVSDIKEKTPAVYLSVVQELSASQFGDHYDEYDRSGNINHLWTRQQIVELNNSGSGNDYERFKWKRQRIWRNKFHYALVSDAEEDKNINNTYSWGFVDDRWMPKEEYKKRLNEELDNKIKIRQELITKLKSNDLNNPTRGVNSSIDVLQRQMKAIEHMRTEFSKVKYGKGQQENKDTYYIDSTQFHSLLDATNDDRPTEKEIEATKQEQRNEKIEQLKQEIQQLRTNLAKEEEKIEEITEKKIKETKEVKIDQGNDIEEKTKELEKRKEELDLKNKKQARNEKIEQLKQEIQQLRTNLAKEEEKIEEITEKKIKETKEVKIDQGNDIEEKTKELAKRKEELDLKNKKQERNEKIEQLKQEIQQLQTNIVKEEEKIEEITEKKFKEIEDVKIDHQNEIEENTKKIEGVKETKEIKIKENIEKNDEIKKKDSVELKKKELERLDLELKKLEEDSKAHTLSIEKSKTVWGRFINYWSQPSSIKKVITLGSMISAGAVAISLFGWFTVASVGIPAFGLLAFIYWLRNRNKVT